MTSIFVYKSENSFFSNFGSTKRWKKFVESEPSEKEKFPQKWKAKTSVQKLGRKSNN